MNNSSFCPGTELFTRVSQIVDFAVYYVVTPVDIIFGLPGHILAILVFYKHYKSHPGYIYQLVYAINALLVFTAQAVFVLSHELCAQNDRPGLACMKYREIYVFMWYEAHLAVPFSNIFFVTGVILALSTSADRLFALAAPVRYRKRNSRRHQSVAIAVSYLIGLAVSVGDFMLYNVQESESLYTATSNRSTPRYSLVVNKDYGSSFLGTQLTWYSRNLVLLISIVGLASCNGIVLFLYRKRNTKVGKMTGSNAAKEAERRAHEKTLLILAVIQSTLSFMSAGALIAFFAGGLFVDNFWSCYAMVSASLVDGMIMLADMSEFYFAFAISKHVRKGAVNILPFLKRWFGLSAASSHVQTLSRQNGS